MIEEQDMTILKEAFKCLEEGNRVFERALAEVRLKPNGKASDIIGLMVMQEKVAQQVLIAKPIAESL